MVAANWHPLTMFSYALDYAIWGLNPPGFHLTNIIFHTLNTILVFILTVRLIDYDMAKQYLYTKKALVTGIITALVFGIHPLHVESVAWVAERKDVLYAFFFLLSIISAISNIPPCIQKIQGSRYSTV